MICAGKKTGSRSCAVNITSARYPRKKRFEIAFAIKAHFGKQRDRQVNAAFEKPVLRKIRNYRIAVRVFAEQPYYLERIFTVAHPERLLKTHGFGAERKLFDDLVLLTHAEHERGFLIGKNAPIEPARALHHGTAAVSAAQRSDRIGKIERALLIVCERGTIPPREIAAILEKENISRENTLISITKVQCSSCLKNATVYVSVYGGGAQAEDEVIQLLESKRALIQKRIAKTIVLKYTPVLRFTADRNLEEGDRVLNILRELEEEK